MGRETNQVEISAKDGDTVIDVEAPMEIFPKQKLHDSAGPSISSNMDGVKSRDTLQILVQKELEALTGQAHVTQPVTIFRVPIFRKSVKHMIEPKMVSIGPYHHGKEALRPLEKHKWRYLRDFLARKPEIGMEVYLKEMIAMEKQARQCYNDIIELSTDEFALMLLLDGCFIIKYLLKFQDGERDYITDVGWTRIEIDFLLLENQVPFSVIHKLGTIHYGTVDHNCEDECLLIDLVCKDMLFEDFFSGSPKLSCTKIDHLLHLYQLRMIPAFDMEQTGKPSQTSNLDQTSNPDQVSNLDETSTLDQTSNTDQSSNTDQTSNSNSNQSLSMKARCLSWLRSKFHLQCGEDDDSGRIPSATELSEVGITFKKKNGARNIFDITFDFKSGVMEMPSLAIDDYTKIMFTNVLLYEQAQKGRIAKNITSYLILMDFLVDTTDDAALLKHCGILTNLLQNDEEVALFFNELCDYTNLNLGESYYYSLCTKVQKYSNLPWHRYRATLVRDYFSNPWAIISFIAAILLLLLTVTQTGFSIYPVVHPN